MRPYYRQIQYLVLAILWISSNQNVMAQGLVNYQWENRLLLIIGDDPSGDLVLAQYTERTVENKERKLIPLVVQPDGYFNTQTSEFIFDPGVFTAYGSNESFTIVLIGLDGGVKAKFNNAVSIDDIYALIDQMPMRKQELKSN